MASSTGSYQSLESRLHGHLFRLPGNDRRVLPDLHHGAVAGLLASDSHHRPCCWDYAAATADDDLGIRPASEAAAAADVVGLPHHDVAVDGGIKACSPNVIAAAGGATAAAVHRPNRDYATAIAAREDYVRPGPGDFLNFADHFLPGSHLLSSVGCLCKT